MGCEVEESVDKHLFLLKFNFGIGVRQKVASRNEVSSLLTRSRRDDHRVHHEHTPLLDG